jgi:hypothetical protein
VNVVVNRAACFESFTSYILFSYADAPAASLSAVLMVHGAGGLGNSVALGEDVGDGGIGGRGAGCPANIVCVKMNNSGLHEAEDAWENYRVPEALAAGDVL